jgi:glycosyltransferase involved in cell wall biosynthesis
VHPLLGSVAAQRRTHKMCLICDRQTYKIRRKRSSGPSVLRAVRMALRPRMLFRSRNHENAMRKQLTILAFAYVYPPDAGSGTFRSLYFANQWAKGSDSVIVVTARERDFSADALIDKRLLGQVDPSIAIERARVFRPHDWLLSVRNRLSKRALSPQVVASRVDDGRQDSASEHGILRKLKNWTSSLLMFPDSHSGWILDATRLGRRIARTRAADCIYATGGPWSGILAATFVHKLTKLPLILDFRDPWASNPNLGEGASSVRRTHARCESYCIRSASRIITNTEELRLDFVARYPDLEPSRFVCITNGFEEFAALEPPQEGRFTLVHAGALYLSRNPQHFLQALAEAVHDNHIPRNRLLVQFVGGIPREDPRIAALLDQLGEVVEIIPRLPHSEALDLQKKASALLLFQAGFPLQVPRKLFEYFSLRRPILAVTEASSATARILKDVGMEYCAEDTVGQIKETLLKLYRAWEAGRMLGTNEERLQAYSNRRLAMRLRDEMAAAVGRS